MYGATAEKVPFTETQARGLMAAWLESADLCEDDLPLTTEQTVAVLAAAGYDIDGDQLVKLQGLKQAPSLAQWDAKDVLALASSLECRRQWRHDGPHAVKFTASMRALLQIIDEGDEAVQALRARQNADLRFVLLLLTECDQRELREKLLATAALILLADHGVRV